MGNSTTIPMTNSGSKTQNKQKTSIYNKMLNEYKKMQNKSLVFGQQGASKLIAKLIDIKLDEG